MREFKLIAASLMLGLFLSLNAFAGHVISGTGMYCEGDCTGKTCTVCGDPCAAPLPADRHTLSASSQGDVMSGLFFFSLALLIAKKRRQ
jgi:hypothetical protein